VEHCGGQDNILVLITDISKIFYSNLPSIKKDTSGSGFPGRFCLFSASYALSIDELFLIILLLLGTPYIVLDDLISVSSLLL
jgi:hypothetical protein